MYWLQITWQPWNILVVLQVRISAWKTPVGVGTALIFFFFFLRAKEHLFILKYHFPINKMSHFLRQKKIQIHITWRISSFIICIVFNDYNVHSWGVTVHWALRHRLGPIQRVQKRSWKLPTTASVLTQNRRRKDLHLIGHRYTQHWRNGEGSVTDSFFI